MLEKHNLIFHLHTESCGSVCGQVYKLTSEVSISDLNFNHVTYYFYVVKRINTNKTQNHCLEYLRFILLISINAARSRVSSGSIVSDYGLDDRAIGVRSPAGAKDFSSSLCVQTGSGAHPASYPMGTGGPFPGGKSAAGA
jgi:hypothetical protein